MIELIIIALGGLINHRLFRIRIGYFSVYQLVTTGFDQSPFIYKAIRSLAPIGVGFLFSLTLGILLVAYDDSVRIGVGAIFPLTLLIPLFVNRELLPYEVIARNRVNEFFVLLTLFLIYYGAASYFGFLIGEKLLNGSFSLYLPTKGELVSAALIPAIFWMAKFAFQVRYERTN